MREIFSARLKEERINAGITRKEIAMKLDIPEKTYTNYAERQGQQKKHLDMLVKIATVPDVILDYLLGLAD